MLMWLGRTALRQTNHRPLHTQTCLPTLPCLHCTTTLQPFSESQAGRAILPADSLLLRHDAPAPCTCARCCQFAYLLSTPALDCGPQEVRAPTGESPPFQARYIHNWTGWQGNSSRWPGKAKGWWCAGCVHLPAYRRCPPQKLLRATQSEC